MSLQKNNFEIIPYTSVGPIQFGMRAEQVRQVLEVPVTTFWKSESSKLPIDAFESLAIHVYYKVPGLCTAVEFGESNIKVTFNDSSFLGKSFNPIKDMLKELDPDYKFNNNGLISFKFGFGLFAPGLTENKNVLIKGVIVFEQGYYNNI